MKKSLLYVCALAVGLALSGISQADVIDNSGAGFSIPDDDPAGASSSITIAVSEIITDVDVTLRQASHTWVGDLVVTLSDGTTSADILVRTGRVGGSGSGDSSNIGADYTFSDGGGDFWAAADAASNGDTIAGGTYAATTTDGAGVSLATIFAGSDTAATWTLTISDNGNGDTGSLGGWGLAITSAAIPEPGSMALIGFVGVALVARRRR